VRSAGAAETWYVSQTTRRLANTMSEKADINTFALQEAELAAAKLWAYGSAPFPFADGARIQQNVEREVTDTTIQFAIHVRRLLDNLAPRQQFELRQPFRHWAPVGGLSKVTGLRDALNRVVHATHFEVGFERLPEDSTRITGGAIGVIYLRTRTDKREDALIDVFALASCFFHQVLPALLSRPSPPPVH